jgi:uncharacterized protein (TIGR03437 family)
LSGCGWIESTATSSDEPVLIIPSAVAEARSLISPAQINVLLSADDTAGSVNFVVTNQGVQSASYPVRMAREAPAFFS